MLTKAPIVFLLYLLANFDSGKCIEEPRCSKYDFEEKVLEKLVRLELKVETSLNDMKKSLAEMSDEQRGFAKVMEAEKNATIIVATDKLNQMGQLVDLYKPYVKNKGTGVAFVVNSCDDDLILDSAIVFKNVVFNLGDGYSDKTGHFTAPVSGLYLFSAQICTKKGNFTRYQLVVNNIVMGASHQYDKDRDGTCSSMTTVAKVDAGNAVFIKCHSSGSDVINKVDEQWNMFVGVLITG